METVTADQSVIAKPVRILIIRFSSIGDIVLTTPVIRCIRTQVPNAEVHFVTKASFRGIVDSNPYVNQVHVLNNSMDDLVNSLKKIKFNHIIDLHNNLRSMTIKKALAGVPAYAFKKLNIQKWLLTAVKINVLPNVHIVDRYLATVQSLGVNNDGMGLDYFIPESDIVSPNDIPTSHIHGFIGIVIGAALNTKKLPVQKLQQLVAGINHPIILLGGPEDRSDGEAVAAIDPIKIYNSCGKFSLNESADLVRRARLIVTHDTGLMHIAAAFKKPIISIWGNTIPAFGMGPYYGLNSQPHNAVEVTGLWCRPCSKIGYKACPLGHFKCMQQQKIDQITYIIKARLA